jgi:Flp pilus assembly protein TadG
MRLRSTLHREEGAAAVEFALVVSLLVLLVFGLMEYGLAFWQVQNLRAAAREGARVAAVGGTSSDISTSMSQASAGSLPGGFGGFTVSPAGGCTGSGTVGQPVTVTIRTSALSASVRDAFSIDVPFLPPIDLNPTLTGTFRCEK